MPKNKTVSACGSLLSYQRHGIHKGKKGKKVLAGRRSSIEDLLRKDLQSIRRKK